MHGSSKTNGIYKALCAESRSGEKYARSTPITDCESTDPIIHSDFEVKGDLRTVGSMPEVFFKNAADGQDISLELVGDWAGKNAEIHESGAVVASISRSFFNGGDFFGEKQTYFVAVAPNVDLSLIAGICVCLDERENEANG